MLFYFLLTLLIAAAILLFVYQRNQRKKPRLKRRMPVVNYNFANKANKPDVEEKNKPLDEGTDPNSLEQSLYDPNLVVLQLNAFPGKPYMGYELHQALLSSGLIFGEGNIFHRHANNPDSKILFSLAAATSNGLFDVDEMGSFKCSGLLLFMHLDPKNKLMTSFDLMLDIARQLAEELGGEIYDDLQNLINVDVIKRLREKICMVETNNLYVSDLLDNLD